MDTDDCSEDEKRKFINKEMFKGHWAYDYIVPIYNIPELETVLTEAKVPFTKTGVKRNILNFSLQIQNIIKLMKSKLKNCLMH